MAQIVPTFVSRFCAVFLLAVCASLPVHADVPSGLEDMLKKAVEKEDEAAFDTIVAMALETWPDDRVAILKLADGVQQAWLHTGFRQEIADADAAAEEAERQSRARGVVYFVDPKLWNAEIQAGAASSTGDTDEQAFTVGFKFNRDFGEQWSHDLTLDFDLARSRGDTTRRRILSRLDTQYRAWEDIYVSNYFEVDFNKFSGFDYRILDSIALGTDLIDNERQKLSLQGGPGVRFNRFEDTDATSTEFLGRLSATYKLKVTDNLNFEDTASLAFGSESTTFDNRASLSAQINSSLAARLTFQVQYDSNSPADAAPWDTITRATLVYDF